jgi:hypothetical protein
MGNMHGRTRKWNNLIFVLRIQTSDYLGNLDVNGKLLKEILRNMRIQGFSGEN